MKRRKHSATFKAQVALDAIRGEMTIAEKDSLFSRAKEKAKKIFQSGGAHRRLEEL